MSGSTLRISTWMPRLSTPTRFSKVNMLSWIFIINSGSICDRPPMMDDSRSTLTKFMILAAALMPPKLDDLADELLANCFFMIDSSSSMAEGCTVSRLAMRCSTSGRASGGKKFSTSAATSYSSTDKMMAVTCGCSLRIMSAIERASIHFKMSRPLLPWPGMMRLSTEEALSSPKARFMTFST